MDYLQRYEMKEAYDNFFNPSNEYLRTRIDYEFVIERIFIIKMIWKNQVTNSYN